MNGRSRAEIWLERIRASGLDAVVLVTTATLFFLQAFRVFVPYLVFEVDQSERETLAEIGVAVFALAFLGALLYRLAGGRVALWLSAAVVIAARLGIQFSEDAGLRWKLGALAIVGCCWLLIVLLPAAGYAAPFGVGIAFTIDLLLRDVRLTVDLPWMPGPAAHLATLAIAAFLVYSAASVASPDRLSSLEAGFVPSLRYVGIGSGFALWLVAAGNLGFAEMRGSSYFLPAPLLGLGSLLALASQAGAFDRWLTGIDERATTLGAGVLAALAIVVWNSNGPSWLNLLSLPLFAYAVTSLTMRSANTALPPTATGRWRCATALTLGLLLQTAFVFLYFARSGQMTLMLIPIALMTLAPLAPHQLSPSRLAGHAPLQHRIAKGAIAIAVPTVVILLLIASALHSIEGFGGLGDTPPAPEGLTVMTFNIQEGFSNENVWNLEETARTIEEHDPDIVFLQEITRGWLVMSSVDQVRWLADRLDMHYVYAGNSHDGLWGNAILSRLPIVSERSVVFSTTDNLRRGAVGIEVETASGNVLAIATHLDNPRKGTPTRLEQIAELVSFLGGATPAIIGGDFNADPGSPEWQAMIDAGFVDSGGDTTETTSEDARRIDYIWITPDLQVASYSVPDVWVSDHRPVVVELAPAS